MSDTPGMLCSWLPRNPELGSNRWVYGFVVGKSGQKSAKRSRRQNHVGVFPSRVHPRGTIHVFGVVDSSHQDRRSAAETSSQFRYDQWGGRRKLSGKE